jgi:hypothetical protein
MGSEGLQGFLLHTVLALGWPEGAGASQEERRPAVEVLGLAHQEYYVRRRLWAGPNKDDSRSRKGRERESQLWQRALKAVGAAPPGRRVVWVADREADIYEVLQTCRTLGYGHVVRAAQDRVLEDPHTGKAAGRLFAAPTLGCFDLCLRARPGQPARQARLSVASAKVHLRSPQRPGHASGFEPAIACTVVRVLEATAPATVSQGLEWFLLCDAACETFEAARECAVQYATRWLIEEFHKGLKTGLGAERLQLSQASRLFAAIAVMSVVALRLLDLREHARREPQAPAEQAGLSPLELQVLRTKLQREIPTVRDVALAVGNLGGHLNRKADGLPGWKTLWLGMRELQLLVEGVQLTRRLRKKFG